MDVFGGSFSIWQFGLQTRKCTEDAWIPVKRCVNDAYSQYVLAIFMDFKGAFDHLELSAVIKRLQSAVVEEVERRPQLNSLNQFLTVLYDGALSSNKDLSSSMHSCESCQK